MQDKSLYATAPAYYTYYFDLVTSNDLIHELQKNNVQVVDFLDSFPDEKWHYRYAARKWTAAEVVRHIIETERVFAYRALRFSRHDATPLPGFNENEFIDHLSHVEFNREDMKRDFQFVRQATVSLFQSMNRDMLSFMGNANGLSISAEMLGFMIVGHTMHHIGIIEERYL